MTSLLSDIITHSLHLLPAVKQQINNVRLAVVTDSAALSAIRRGKKFKTHVVSFPLTPGITNYFIKLIIF